MSPFRTLIIVIFVQFIFLAWETVVYAQSSLNKTPAGGTDKTVVAKPVEVPRDTKKKDKPSLIIFDIVPEKGVEKGEANLLTEIVIDEVNLLNRYVVIGQKDLDKMLSWEQSKQLRGCSNTSCLIQLAGAMGADYYLEGSVGAFGGRYIITLKLVDAMEVKVLRRLTEKVEQNDEKLVDVMESLIERVMEIPAQSKVAQTNGELRATTAAVYPMNPYKKWGHVSFWTGLGVAGLGGLFTGLAANAAADYRKSGGDKDAIANYNTAAVSFYSVGGALMATGIVLWALSPGDKAWAKKHNLSIAPVLEPGIGMMAIGGEW